MAKVVKKSVGPIYMVGALWLVWAFVLPLYHPAHYAAAVVLSFAAYLIGRALFPDKAFKTPEPKVEQQPKQESEASKQEKKPESTGNPELDALVGERDRAVSEMRRLNSSIEDPTISAQIDHLETTTKKIIAYVVEHPEKLPQIRRFLNYYLPTTLKLLNAYDRMDAVGVSGANIDGTMGKIETMMDTIVTAFDRQLDALFGDEALDISTDITVMEQMLAREGIGGTQLPTEET
jgi:hypothetical protein